MRVTSSYFRRSRSLALFRSVALVPFAPNRRCILLVRRKTNAVLDYFKLNTFHVFGHGTGAQVALELGKRMGRPSPRPPGPEVEAVLSVILASPVLSGNELPPDFLESLRTPYTRGGNEVSHCRPDP